MSIHFGAIMVKITKLNPKCCFLKVPNDKQLPSCKIADQNVEKNQSYEAFYRLKFSKMP